MNQGDTISLGFPNDGGRYAGVAADSEFSEHLESAVCS